MEEVFDPYRKWLGIPPEEQPPNHYRLLGIALYETDPDVISNAADRQMAHVRTFQTGKRAPLSQALLNELSGARICLLNADSKQQYDEKLLAWHSQLTRAVAAPVGHLPQPMVPTAVRVAGIPTAIPIANPEHKVAGETIAGKTVPTIRTRSSKHAVLFPGAAEPEPAPIPETVSLRPAAVRPVAVRPFAHQPVSLNAVAPIAIEPGTLNVPDADDSLAENPAPVSIRGPGPRVARKSSSTAIVSGIIAVGILGLLIILVAMFFSGDDPSTSDSNRDRPSAKEKKTAASAPQLPSNTSTVNAPTVNAPTVNAPTNERPPTLPKTTATPEKKPEETDRGDKELPTKGVAANNEPPKVKPETPKTPQTPTRVEPPSRTVAAKRPSPPPADAAGKAYRILRKELEPQLRGAVDLQERHDLVAQLVERAAKEKEPVNQYALYMIAHNLGVQLASADTVCDVIDLMAARYDVDAFEMKRAAVDQISQFVTLGVEDYDHLLRLVQRLAREAIAAEKSDAALALSRLAKGASLKVRTPKALKEFPALEDLLADVDRLAADAAEFDREVKAFERNAKILEKEPNDAAANLSVGRYWLLVKGDWGKALPHFAKSADPTVKDPAILDLAGPKSAAEQVALADTWAALAQRKGGLHAPRLLERAKHWYAQATQTAADGEKQAIEAKIAHVDGQLQTVSQPAVAVPKETNAVEGDKTEREATETENVGSDKTADTEKPADEKSADEKQPAEKPVEEKPLDEKPLDEKPIDEKPMDDATPESSESPESPPVKPSTPSPADDAAPEFPD